MRNRLIRANAVDDKLLSRLIELEPVDKLVGYAASLRAAWVNASTDGTLMENFDTIDEWFASYGSAVTYDAIADARSLDPEFDKMYTALGDQSGFNQSVDAYVNSLAPRITVNLK